MKFFQSFFLLFLFAPFFTIIAQDNPTVEKNQFKINMLLPGFVYEHGFSNKNTLYSELSFGVGYRDSGFNGSSWSFYPSITEQFRHYYNLEKRTNKGKVTTNNSGSFVALHADYRFRAISSNESHIPTESSFTIAPVWGFERTYKRNFNLALYTGVGYNINSDLNDGGFVPVLNFSLGWVIGK
ncbi:hypothetical protein [Flavobacterium taihuense]|uniref:Secreted protein n=1 Tax=Flavobacterium taihuense TaxID=2857508 RepID=A0ABS6XYV0_9FLAO|nr:hypothetical protein [Flavobacterium taihuense]MBW4361842.1 hypothetical protein [Flavobacterium taihuense]